MEMDNNDHIILKKKISSKDKCLNEFLERNNLDQDDLYKPKISFKDNLYYIKK